LAKLEFGQKSKFAKKEENFPETQNFGQKPNWGKTDIFVQKQNFCQYKFDFATSHFLAKI